MVAKPEEKLGEIPAAFIELKPGVPAPTAEEIIARCRAHLAAYKVPPRSVHGDFQDEHGMIQRSALRERAKGM